MPLVILAIWRSVILSPLGMPSTYWSIVSSSESSPSAAAWRSRLTVKVLLTLPIRWCTSGVIGSSEERSATPRVSTHVYWGVWIAATTPGAPLSEKDCSNAAFRASSGAWSPPPVEVACSVPSVVVVSSAESSSWLLPPPPQLLTRTAANAVTTSTISRLWYIPYAKNIPSLPVDQRNDATGRTLVLPTNLSFREDKLAAARA